MVPSVISIEYILSSWALLCRMEKWKTVNIFRLGWISPGFLSDWSWREKGKKTNCTAFACQYIYPLSSIQQEVFCLFVDTIDGSERMRGGGRMPQSKACLFCLGLQIALGHHPNPLLLYEGINSTIKVISLFFVLLLDNNHHKTKPCSFLISTYNCSMFKRLFHSILWWG